MKILTTCPIWVPVLIQILQTSKFTSKVSSSCWKILIHTKRMAWTNYHQCCWKKLLMRSHLHSKLLFSCKPHLPKAAYTSVRKRRTPVFKRVQKRWRHRKLFWISLCFGYHVSVEHDEKHPQPKLGWNRFMGPEIWPHEYLISPNEISVNWSGSKQLWTRPIYTDFNGAN